MLNKIKWFAIGTLIGYVLFVAWHDCPPCADSEGVPDDDFDLDEELADNNAERRLSGKKVIASKKILKERGWVA